GLPELEREKLLEVYGEQPDSALAEVTGQQVDARARRHDTSVAIRRAYGKIFASWCADKSIDLHKRLPWGTSALFWREHAGCAKLSGRRLVEYARAYLAHGFRITGRCRTSGPQGDHERHRRRLTGLQGRPFKSPGLRQLLFEWFCSIRGAVKTRIPLAALAAQARLLREEYLATALRQRQEVAVPRVTPMWLLRWRREFGVSLRTPNRRWKVSRAVCLERCRITWLNLVRVRQLCLLCNGYD
ncbi:MAG: hypothetical protein GY772_30955, partial [bacterium]|nr:hypothetical protein [bacterium]